MCGRVVMEEQQSTGGLCAVYLLVSQSLCQGER